MLKKIFPLSKVYTLLESGPVILLTTSRAGTPNIMAMSWHMMVDFEPPLIAVILSDQSYSCKTLQKTGECVINIPTIALGDKVVGCGNTTGAKADKFKKFGLTPVPASIVKAPLIKECFANIECRVKDTGMMKKYGMFVLEGVKAWVDPAVKNPKTLHHRGKSSFMIAGKTVVLKSKVN